jgi:hypothetical protein
MQSAIAHPAKAFISFLIRVLMVSTIALIIVLLLSEALVNRIPHSKQVEDACLTPRFGATNAELRTRSQAS